MGLFDIFSKRPTEEEIKRKRNEELKRIEEEKQSNFNARVSQIENGQMFKMLLSYITDIIKTESPYRIDIASSEVTLYLKGTTKTFNFEVNGIKEIPISLHDNDNRDSDLYVVAYAINKNIKSDFSIEVSDAVVNEWRDGFHKSIRKVSLKRKLQSLI